MDYLMDLGADQFFDVIGHNFLDTIDLDVMEQTIIDDVMAEISVSEQITMTEPVISQSKSEQVAEITVSEQITATVPLITRCRSEPVMADSPISRTQSEPVLKNVIEAVDVEGLLEQFEEASQGMDSKVTEEVQAEVPVFTLQTPIKELDGKDKNGNLEKKELTNDMLLKLKSSNKPKSAVMLPMMVPAKRGRGRAMTRGHPVALPASCTPRRLQRVMMQNAELKDSLALAEEESVSNKDQIDGDKVLTESVADAKVTHLGSEVKKKDVNSNVDQNYFEHVSDHDYFKNSGKTEHFSSSVKDFVREYDLDLDFEEGEIVDEDINKDKNKNLKSSKSRDDLSEDRGDPAQFFDKLPSYYTALSIPRKQVKKTASCVTGRGGITVNDYFERDVSPIRDPSTYSKLPEYCSSFTNSTKYDSLAEGSLQKCSDDSKASSGYSSLTHSPDLSIRSSRSKSQSLSRSRSRSFSRSRSVQRSLGQQRKSSYSSCSGCSGSSCSRSSCSDSSCSRSSSRSSSGSSGRSLSCSTCGSRSSSASSRSPSRSPSREPSRSHERSWRREREFRRERSRRERRSRSRRRSRSHRRHFRISRSRSRYHSYSRSRSRDYRSRSRSLRRMREMRRRDESLERFREERKKQREEEKEQQMKERRIVYVGGLPHKYSRHSLRDHFSRFGPIENVQLHFREHGDNYGFVTFTYTCDAFAAIEKGKKIPALAKFDLCFGGRRQFCDVEYADLDGNKEIEEEFDSKPPKMGGAMDFDELLRQAKAGIKRS